MSSHDSLDIMLIHHSTDNIHRPILFSAMGLFSIADNLDNNGFRTQILHLGIERTLNQDFDEVNYCISTGARVIGLSCYWFFQLPESLKLAQKIKEANPHIVIVMGGFSASFFFEEIIRDHPYVDAVIRGDGEIPLLELCKLINSRRKKPWDNAPNIVYRAPDGRVKATAFTHTVTETQLNEYNFSRLNLMKNYRGYVASSSFWTRRFKERFKNGGLFPLLTGRGCPHFCTFCGGNAKAQMVINNKRSPIFRSVESVVATIEEAVTYGYKNFYVCFDPYPNWTYYFDLFRAIRKKKFEIRLCFGSWRLPSIRFINEFSRTFIDGIIEISPETSSESLRKLNKGILSYSNQELAKTLKYLKKRGLLCQLYFGYFLPGDTVHSVNHTLKFARDLDSDFCETFYLPLSTDPASLLYFSPDKYHMNVTIRSLQDYINALSRKRVASNLLEHRPKAIGANEARFLTTKISVEHLLYNILPFSLEALKSVWKKRNLFLSRMEKFYSTVYSVTDIEDSWDVIHLIELFKQFIKSERTEEGDTLFILLDDIINYESIPYLLYKRYFSDISNHYSFSLQEIHMGKEELRKFIKRRDTVAVTHTFHYDVKSLLSEIVNWGTLNPHPQETEIGFVLDSARRYTTFLPKRLNYSVRGINKTQGKCENEVMNWIAIS